MNHTPQSSRPWYLRWWVLTAAAAALAVACSSPGVDGGDGGINDNDSGGEAGDIAEDYPTFEAVEVSGESDGLVDLPEGVTQAMITARHDGEHYFSISALDDANEETGDLLVNAIGAYSGTTALGLVDLGAEPVRLEVVADGAWTVNVAPLADAPALPEGAEGDGVFLYEGGAASWEITHDGEHYFSVDYYTGGSLSSSGLVTEIGAYEGTVAVTDGPAFVVVAADGAWTITR